MNYLFVLNEDLRKSYVGEESKQNVVEYSYIVFNGGEPHITIKDPEKYDNATQVVFATKIKSANDFIKLAAAVNAFANLGSGADFFLDIAYFPGGRQDRVCNDGEAFTAKMYAQLIDSLCEWGCVQVIDAHSDVTTAVLENGYNNNNHLFVKTALEEIDLFEGVIISPDAGSNKKIFDVVKMLNKSGFTFEVVRADKLRNLSTGEIIETTVYASEDDIRGKDCIIIDDICDGGRTFIELAQVLKRKRGAKTVTLLVTHGIFSKGFEPILQDIDQIVTTNSFIDSDVDDGDRITVIGLNENYFRRK